MKSENDNMKGSEVMLEQNEKLEPSIEGALFAIGKRDVPFDFVKMTCKRFERAQDLLFVKTVLVFIASLSIVSIPIVWLFFANFKTAVIRFADMVELVVVTVKASAILFSTSPVLWLLISSSLFVLCFALTLTTLRLQKTLSI